MNEVEDPYEGIEVADEVMAAIKLLIRESIDRHNQVMSSPTSVDLEDFCIDIQVHQLKANTMTKGSVECWLIDSTGLILRNKKNLKVV